MAKTGLTPTDELVRRAVQGDGTAFTELWDTNIEALRAYLVSSLGMMDGFFIDDICSRSFEKAFRQICSYDPSRSRFSTWLKVIARNTALDVLESESRETRRMVSIDDGNVNVSELDSIEAETADAAANAAGQLGGAVKRRIDPIYDALTGLCAHFHAVLDYPDEDIDPFSARTLDEALSGAERDLCSLLESYQRGKLLVEGIPCAIVGRPNAGKSSLLNALLGYERAIVTDIPGTTRDTVEEKCTLGGRLLRLIDTAGIRETGDAVERLGVERSRRALEGAELALVLLDSTAPLGPEDADILDLASAVPHVIRVYTKADLPGSVPPPPEEEHAVLLSSRTGAGLSELEAAIAACFPAGADQERGELLTNARQAEAAGRALSAVRSARESLDMGMTPDAVLVDVEGAMGALGELTGRNLREDVTGRIFARFCVGK